MEENLFEFRFNQLLEENERIFKLSSADLNEENLSVTLLIEAGDYDKKLNSQLKSKVYNAVASLIPPSIKTRVNYKKTVSEPEHIRKEVLTFFYTNSSFLFQALSDSEIIVGIGYDIITISLKVARDIYAYLNGSQYIKKLSEYLDGLFLESAEIILIPIDKEEGQGLPIKYRRNKKETGGIKTVDIEIIDVISGSIKKSPIYISETPSMQNSTVSVCGKIANIEERVSKNGKKYFTFQLNDTTGAIKVMYFTRSENIFAKFSGIKDGDAICVEGELKSNDGKSNFYILSSSASRCTIDYNSIKNEVQYLDYPENYEVVFPQIYEDNEQVNLFEQEECIESLKGDFVIFDLETTGLSANRDKITEIGAVKMRDGIIIETFSTLIDPEVPIPAEITVLTGINDEMVKNKPKISEVIGDFYKFTKDSILVAQNSSFDMGFIAYNAQKNHYRFDNSVIDTLTLARQKVILRKYNLGFMCAHFNIDLTNAHRAVHDAVATAKLFKKLVAL